MLVLELCLEGQASNLTQIRRPAGLLSGAIFALQSCSSLWMPLFFFFFFFLNNTLGFFSFLPALSLCGCYLYILSHSPKCQYLPEGGVFTDIWCLGLPLRVRFTSRVLVLHLVPLFYVWFPGFCSCRQRTPLFFLFLFFFSWLWGLCSWVLQDYNQRSQSSSPADTSRAQ